MKSDMNKIKAMKSIATIEDRATAVASKIGAMIVDAASSHFRPDDPLEFIGILPKAADKRIRTIRNGTGRTGKYGATLEEPISDKDIESYWSPGDKKRTIVNSTSVSGSTYKYELIHPTPNDEEEYRCVYFVTNDISSGQKKSIEIAQGVAFEDEAEAERYAIGLNDKKLTVQKDVADKHKNYDSDKDRRKRQKGVATDDSSKYTEKKGVGSDKVYYENNIKEWMEDTSNKAIASQDMNTRTLLKNLKKVILDPAITFEDKVKEINSIIDDVPTNWLGGWDVDSKVMDKVLEIRNWYAERPGKACEDRRTAKEFIPEDYDLNIEEDLIEALVKHKEHCVRKKDTSGASEMEFLLLTMGFMAFNEDSHDTYKVINHEVTEAEFEKISELIVDKVDSKVGILAEKVKDWAENHNLGYESRSDLSSSMG